MTCTLNLQRNTEVFFSTVDLAGGAAVATMTPKNTWKVEVLAGYAVSQAAATQDITTLESGTTPDRGSARFFSAINPVDWNFQVYVRPTGIETPANGDNVSTSSNVKPIAGWYLWQALLSNVNPSSGASEQSAWQVGGRFDTVERAGTANVFPHTGNYGTANGNHLYFKMGNVIYQVSNAAVNQATLDSAIDAIATTTWTGFGTNLIELTGVPRNNAVSVFGGTLNGGTTATANANAYAITATHSFHPWDTWNVAGTAATASFIKNRLSSIAMNFQPNGGANQLYNFPVTSMTFGYNNNISFLTPEELGKLNTPIGNFTGARDISGTLTAYLKVGSGRSAQLLRDILGDRRTSHSTSANANLQVGGTTAPYMAFYMPAVQFDLPVHQIEDVISLQMNFKAFEPTINCGLGGEVEIFVRK